MRPRVPRSRAAAAVAIATATALSAAPATATPSAGELLRDIEQLQVVGSVLYVAAHPDDENTRLIAWLEQERGLRTAYLSMTRGGGGQNLIGPEQDALLGAVRTGELLAAREIDGGEQLFTRMRDFGYSKSAEEALARWGHDEALDDVVRAIRTFRPDVVVTRFGADAQSHGHHVASARLAAEAFAAAADPAYVTEGLAPWAADRLLHNQSTWSLPEGADTSHLLRVDVGTFDARTGRWVGELAAASRTMHKSQGMGSEPERGPIEELFAPLAGRPLAPGDDPFGGFDTTWGRYPGTRPLARALRAAADRFDARAPHEVLPHLARAHAALEDVPDPHWRALATADLEQVLLDAAGVWLQARADRAAVAPGGSLQVTVDVGVGSPAEVVVRSVALGPAAAAPADLELGAEVPPDGPLHELSPDQPFHLASELPILADQPLTRPPWLVEAPEPTRYVVTDPAWRNAPDGPPTLEATFVLTVAGRDLVVRRPIVFAWTDPVDGERTHPVEVLPPLTATFAQPGVAVPRGGVATTRVTVAATAGAAAGTLRLVPPPGVTVEPAEVALDLASGAEQVVELRVAAAGEAAAGTVRAEIVVGDRVDAVQRAVVDYPHLPRRTVLLPAELRVAPVELQRGAVVRVGYVPGSGDGVAEALRSVGYDVAVLDDAALGGDLSGYDAIVTGIRAFNTRPELAGRHAALMAYVAGGGRLVVQYNTNNRFDPLDQPLGPLPFTIGRGRVTEEDAALVPVDPAHPALLGPNALGAGDFAGWVQERGLYYAEAWDPQYQPLFAAHDAGEPDLLGGTLLARHGDGVFVYTGLAFFRQLPAGVPGAYRLFANLLAAPGGAP